jgi:hypothetical protein
MNRQPDASPNVYRVPISGFPKTEKQMKQKNAHNINVIVEAKNFCLHCCQKKIMTE